jgi:hypothetical protein
LRQEPAGGDRGLESLEFLPGAIVRALMTGVVTMEQFEGLADTVVLEGLWAEGEVFGFHSLDAQPVPGGMQEGIEGDHLKGAFRANFLEKVLFISSNSSQSSSGTKRSRAAKP